MTGLILSGRRDSQLRLLTDTSAKQPVLVANTPVSFCEIEALAAFRSHYQRQYGHGA